MIPNVTVPFVDAEGHATPAYQQLFDLPNAPLVDKDGLPTRELAGFLMTAGVQYNLTAPVVDREGLPVPLFYQRLVGLNG